MADDLAKTILSIASYIQKDADDNLVHVRDEPVIVRNQILPEIIAKDCKVYIKHIVSEINGSYENGLHCGCTVMIRRLLETCIIEAFEAKKKSQLIKTADGTFVGGNDMRVALYNDPFDNLPRGTKRALANKNIIEYGNKAAHDRYWIARRQDVDRIIDDARSVFEYLVHQFA